MSGHSKWHNIKIKKGKMDSLRGKLFTKVSKEIHMAVREGGPDPDNNFRLKVAIGRARDVNMPADSIKRTIEKASGSGSTDYEEFIYEGYGPAGVALIMEIATDNRNRSAAEVRRIFTKNGGSLGETGCVAWMFLKKGLIVISGGAVDEDTLMTVALEAGAEDLQNTDDGFEIVTELAALSAVRAALDDKKIAYESAEITWIPQNTVQVKEDDAANVLRLMEELEELDDVQQVYANFDIPREIMDKLGA
ncbi:MAG: YebC/PmpR family DNA-binding transcriptional regulator [Candidatus Eremiobacteraeota bacterium]|nr:YebC/PmpR family DNA-binding transcriptional regulator [Candidatus Eremiobacteraeota bacterium]